MVANISRILDTKVIVKNTFIQDIVPDDADASSETTAGPSRTRSRTCPPKIQSESEQLSLTTLPQQESQPKLQQPKLQQPKPKLVQQQQQQPEEQQPEEEPETMQPEQEPPLPTPEPMPLHLLLNDRAVVQQQHNHENMAAMQWWQWHQMQMQQAAAFFNVWPAPAGAFFPPPPLPLAHPHLFEVTDVAVYERPSYETEPLLVVRLQGARFMTRVQVCSAVKKGLEAQGVVVDVDDMPGVSQLVIFALRDRWTWEHLNHSGTIKGTNVEYHMGDKTDPATNQLTLAVLLVRSQPREIPNCMACINEDLQITEADGTVVNKPLCIHYAIGKCKGACFGNGKLRHDTYGGARCAWWRMVEVWEPPLPARVLQ
eukprot:CAMPEP_0178384148 /NCGR_PEP_ID=MMETSP0689_2-20121128/7367_1 /TAXON_ID=160604 /ORGANISM="Amphidinium massartii, Strain CS-259" /LENGTH=369 /DNA_ID=CAMNT_0020004389 /DNA_START=82 /DNA_END=1191 /DNA_ORIENTATION=+